MKKYIAVMLVICMALMLGGCAEKKKEEEKATPSVQIAYAAYQYDQGYQLSEGWMYDMTISAEGQLNELNGLVDQLSLKIKDELFEHGRGYRITFRDAAGNTTRELLLLDNGEASVEGMVYKAENAEALAAWLAGLKIDEQAVE